MTFLKNKKHMLNEPNSVECKKSNCHADEGQHLKQLSC